MESYLVHYKNKFPGCNVQMTENSLDVFSAEGEHLIALRKNGAGQWQDESEKMGCVEKHCLAPIPKESRVHKMQGGKFGLSEEHEARRKQRPKFMENGKVLSIDELQQKGFRFDHGGMLLSEPQKPAQAAKEKAS